MRSLFKGIRSVAGLSVPAKFDAIYNKYRDYTMIPRRSYVDNLRVIQPLLESGGDVIECGVWKGGMIAGIAEVLGKERVYHLFDSFEGLPKAKEIDGKLANDWQQNTSAAEYYDNCKAEESSVSQLMNTLGAKFHVHKGWFEDTFSSYEQRSPVDLLRLDADWYDSTMSCLQKFYAHVRSGGIIIIDDYYAWEGCSKAVHDFLSMTKSPARIRSGASFAYIVK